MSDDLLREATRAVREATQDSGSAAFTRMRIMHSLHGARRRRLTRFAVWTPLAVVLAGATAAAATGRAGRVWLAIERAVLSTPSAADDQKPGPAARRLMARSPTPNKPRAFEFRPRETPAASERLEPVDAQSEREHERAAHRVAPAGTSEVMNKTLSDSLEHGSTEKEPTMTPEPTSAPPSEDNVAAARELALYRTAHRAHFQHHDCSGAVLAWERYLAGAPRGRFTLEARYNRALCLVRLGREHEAAAALWPFAQGSYGGYRRRDARALLRALGSEDAGEPPSVGERQP